MNYIDVILFGLGGFLAGSGVTYMMYSKLSAEFTKLRLDWEGLENRLTTKLAVIDNKVTPAYSVSVPINPNNKF